MCVEHSCTLGAVIKRPHSMYERGHALDSSVATLVHRVGAFYYSAERAKMLHTHRTCGPVQPQVCPYFLLHPPPELSLTSAFCKKRSRRSRACGRSGEVCNRKYGHTCGCTGPHVLCVWNILARSAQ